MAFFQIKGVIFDSAPGKRRILSLFRAISAILGGNFWYNLPVSIFMTMFLSMIWFYEVFSKNYFKGLVLSCVFRWLATT